MAKELAAKSAMPKPAVAPIKALAPTAAVRVEEIRGAILDLEMGDFIDWRRHGALHAELASLAA
ncbi:hypothetical protein [uncultured Devosia sp.]|uniref:hypothetical protein n=1 Tax=uncultured Devosia sp. TaxID=211434 RepID=UPI0035CA01BF